MRGFVAPSPGTSRQVVLALPADLVPVLNGREAIGLDQLVQVRDWLKTVQLVGSQADARSAAVLLERFDAIAPARCCHRRFGPP